MATLIDFAIAHTYISAVLTFLLLHAAYSILGLIANIRYARSTGLKYVVYPIDKSSIFVRTAFIFSFVFTAINALPSEAWRDYFNDWTYPTKWKVRSRVSNKLGGLYLMVSPGEVWATCGERELVNQVISERWAKPLGEYDLLLIYGNNVVASEGKDWAHHRKYTTPAFTERNNAFVWRESLTQARAMLASWTSASTASTSIPHVFPDLMKLTLHVISSAGFGVPLAFNESAAQETVALEPFTTKSGEGYTFPYREAMHFICNNVVMHVVAMSLPPIIGRRFFHAHYAAHKDYRNYMRAMVAAASRGRTDDVLHLMLDNMAEEKSLEKNDDKDPGLTTKELHGNIFIITLAGHETSSRALHYALIMLALHPSIQTWITADLPSTDPDSWVYETTLPRLTRVNCLLLEVLRYFCIVGMLPKCTDPAGAKLGPHFLRPMNVNISVPTLHFDIASYGPTADIFDPTRWDAMNKESYLARFEGQGGRIAPGLEWEGIHRPPRGAFIGFADGVRACMGRKFAVVEFCATVAVILREYQIRIVKKDGETEEAAQGRVWSEVDDSKSTMAMGVRRWEKIEMCLEKR